MRSGCYCQVRLVQKQTKPPKGLNNTPGPPPPPPNPNVPLPLFPISPWQWKIWVGGGGTRCITEPLWRLGLFLYQPNLALQSPSKTSLVQKCGGKNVYYGQCENTAFTFPYYRHVTLSSFTSFLHFTFQLFSTIILCYIRWLSNHKMVCSMFID